MSCAQKLVISRPAASARNAHSIQTAGLAAWPIKFVTMDMTPTLQAPLNSAAASVQAIIVRDPRKKKRIRFMLEMRGGQEHGGKHGSFHALALGAASASASSRLAFSVLATDFTCG